LNHLLNVHFLKNRYILIRHGESISNVKHIINSNPDQSKQGFRLTRKGVRQAKRLIRQLKPLIRHREIIVYSSDFTRAIQTANIFCKKLKQSVTTEPRLNERYFGEFDGGPSSGYKLVWENDKNSPNKAFHFTEKLTCVIDRVSSFIVELEQTYSDKTILLFSHGDTLKFLEFAFKKQPYGFNLLPTVLKNCEFREIREL